MLKNYIIFSSHWTSFGVFGVGPNWTDRYKLLPTGYILMVAQKRYVIFMRHLKNMRTA